MFQRKDDLGPVYLVLEDMRENVKDDMCEKYFKNFEIALHALQEALNIRYDVQLDEIVSKITDAFVECLEENVPEIKIRGSCEEYYTTLFEEYITGEWSKDDIIRKLVMYLDNQVKENIVKKFVNGIQAMVKEVNNG